MFFWNPYTGTPTHTRVYVNAPLQSRTAAMSRGGIAVGMPRVG